MNNNSEHKGNSTNTEIVKRFINEVVNGAHLELVNELWASDMQWHGGSLGEINGTAAYSKMLEASVGGAFTQMHLDIKDIISADDKVVVRFTNSGRQTGPFMGMRATDRKAEWEGIGIYRIRDGKIAEAWFSEDILAMLTQLDIVKLPE